MKAAFGTPFGALSFVVIGLGVAGCTDGLLTVTYSGVKPVYPLPLADSMPLGVNGNVDPSVTVESTTPTLKWNAEEGVRSYDVAVWECPRRYLTGMFAQELGEQVFFASRVPGDSVKITPPLKSMQRYFWSVRPTGTESWSTYNIYEPLKYAALQPTGSSKGLYYKFVVP